MEAIFLMILKAAAPQLLARLAVAVGPQVGAVITELAPTLEPLLAQIGGDLLKKIITAPEMLTDAEKVRAADAWMTRSTRFGS